MCIIYLQIDLSMGKVGRNQIGAQGRWENPYERGIFSLGSLLALASVLLSVDTDH